MGAVLLLVGSAFAQVVGPSQYLAKTNRANTWTAMQIFGGDPPIRIPHAAAPASPTNGDFWSTTLGFYGRVNGATVGPFISSGGLPANVALTDADNNWTSFQNFDGGLYSTGTVGALPGAASGIGSFFGYYPGKQALFGGTWTAASGAGAGLIDANIGTKTVCWGTDSKCSGENAVGVGYFAEASGPRTFAAGNNAKAMDDDSFAVGGPSQAGATGGVGGNGAVGIEAYSGNAAGTNNFAFCAYCNINTTSGNDGFGFGKSLKSDSNFAMTIGHGIDDVDQLLNNSTSIYFGNGSTVPSLTISRAGGSPGDLSQIGIALGTTAPTDYLDVAASTASVSSLRLRHGTAPTGGNLRDGQLWTTTAGLYARINGGTVGPLIDASGATPSFDDITSGTNTAATMTFGTGSTLARSGSGVISATSFFSTGTLEDARLSANVPLIDAANVFTGDNQFDRVITCDGSDANCIRLMATSGQVLRVETTAGALRPLITLEHNMTQIGLDVGIYPCERDGTICAYSTGTANFPFWAGAMWHLDPGTKPTCDSTLRGQTWFDAGGAGVPDSMEICAKSTLDAYSWYALAVIP